MVALMRMSPSEVWERVRRFAQERLANNEPVYTNDKGVRNFITDVADGSIGRHSDDGRTNVSRATRSEVEKVWAELNGGPEANVLYFTRALVAQALPELVEVTDGRLGLRGSPSSPPPASWALKPGERIRRTELHDAFGGGRQGGISPSRQSPNVLIFSDPEVGPQYGYFDGWREDGLFHYTGEGQRGDQEMARGNAAILNHRDEGRRLRVFDGVRDEVKYVGEFEVDHEKPYYRTDAPEFGSDRVRQVIVFRLRPIDAIQSGQGMPLDLLPKNPVTEVDIENNNTESTFVQPAAQGWEIERREQKLVQAYKAFLKKKGIDAVRHLIRPPGEAKPIFSDVFVKQRNHLIEAKGSVAREAIRMAIGQLLDYGRFVSPKPRLAVLLPEKPRPDLCELLMSVGVAIIWQNDDGSFSDSESGAFT
jgi:hypothetical protein